MFLIRWSRIIDMTTFRKVFIALSFLVMLLIFIFSARDATKSSSDSGRIGRFIVKHFYRDYEDMTEAQIDMEVESITYVVRKTAHFTEYLILGLCLCAAVSRGLIRPFTIGMLYSVTDEIHQYFVPGRACMFMDVLLDSFGVMTGVICMYIFMHFFMKNQRRLLKYERREKICC